MKSKLFTLNITDAQKGILLAGISVGGTAIIKAIEVAATAGRLPTMAEMAVAVKIGIGSFAAYLIKNFLTNSNDQIGRKEK